MVIFEVDVDVIDSDTIPALKWLGDGTGVLIKITENAKIELKEVFPLTKNRNDNLNLPIFQHSLTFANIHFLILVHLLSIT